MEDKLVIRKTPCVDCPYLKTSDWESYGTLNAPKESYSSRKHSHPCHKSYFKVACKGSLEWGKKLEGKPHMEGLKELYQLEIKDNT